MDNGNAELGECEEVISTPHPVIDVPASSTPGVPTAIPTVVEPNATSGQISKPGRKRGPKPIATQYRMEMLNKFIAGDFEGGEINRLKFIRVTQFTPQEKSYLINHACFKELYDAKLFDWLLDPTQLPTKEELKMIEILGRRLGLNKPATQVNVQVNNNRSGESKGDKDSQDSGPISIKVQR